MSGLEPFEPDDIYCVHCHAPAAGMCAECKALCCADCVELRLGWTREQAICRVCLRHGEAPAGTGARRSPPWPWIAAAAAVLALAVLWSL